MEYEVADRQTRIMIICMEQISEHIKSEEMVLDYFYPDIADLIPLIIICGISLLLTILWLILVLECVRPRKRKDCKQQD